MTESLGEARQQHVTLQQELGTMGAAALPDWQSEKKRFDTRLSDLSDRVGSLDHQIDDTH